MHTVSLGMGTEFYLERHGRKTQRSRAARGRAGVKEAGWLCRSDVGIVETFYIMTKS